MRNMAIDDPLAATARQYPEQPKNKVGELALELAGVAFPLFKVFNIVRSRILGDYGLERIGALLNALQVEFHREQQRSRRLSATSKLSRRRSIRQNSRTR
jgi:hypothetical protein